MSQNKQENITKGNDSKPKPCCVCLTEKKLRDECLLFNGQESGKCNELIQLYKACMKGYGFETN
ncbi:uncharacterized protein PRCAT00004961001 [Priceomyces carsonii]|uniref:uncharacterized protein n=1 Tax=Priceomyces carsonii TaxID=28549 RepID=UPI002EDACB2C|nr:unnamed protein product [Priceomyces carsonii]